MMKFEVWTDGSCHYKTRRGGIGVFIKREDGLEVYYSKGYYDTTISRMELRAIIKALQLIEMKVGSHITIYCDSEYTVNSINRKWVLQWERDCWVGRKNADLWNLFLVELRKFFGGKVEFKWCKSHDGEYGNEVADILADYRTQDTWDEDEKSNLYSQ